MTRPANHEAYLIPGLARGLAALEIIAQRGEIRGAELAAELGIGRSSAHRILYTLRDAGFLREGGTRGAYVPTARVLSLGFAWLARQPLATRAAPHLAALRDRAGVSAHLSVLDGTDALYLASEGARSAYVSNIVPGHRVPAHVGANGWVLLGGLDDAAFDAFCAECDFVPRTEHTPTDADALRRRIAHARTTGHVLSRGFADPAGASLSVPVRGPGGTVPACVSLSGPMSGFDFDRVDDLYLPATRAAAEAVAAELGHTVT
ncbi:MAG: IclR family transcriptional regulator [Pseudomonadota bacterium]